MTALLEIMVTKRDFCSTPQFVSHSKDCGSPVFSVGVWSQVFFCVCSFYAPHVGIAVDAGVEFWRTLAGSVHRVSHTHPGLPMLLAGDSNVWLPPFQFGRSRQADSSLVPIIQEMMQSHSLVLRNPLDAPTHRCGAALDIILATRSLSCHVAVHCGSIWCSFAPFCSRLIISSALAELTFPSLCLLFQALPPPCLAFETGHQWLLRAMLVSLSGTSLS